ncbi:MAG: hypothetical protein KDB22_18415, partial [Planctomycetales bacterium]|nr:hypothetical protein [Planctomycetales bacterium]
MGRSGKKASQTKVDVLSSASNPTGLSMLSMAMLFVAVAVFIYDVRSIRWIPSLSTDSLVYHLTIPAWWYQQGLFTEVDLPFHDGAAQHSPLITEVIIYGLMTLTGDDGLAYLVQPTFLLFTAWLFFRILHCLGMKATSARFLTVLLLLFPPFFRSAQIVNSEVVLVCGTALFCYGALVARSRAGRGLVLTSAGIALMLAAKTIGIIYGAIAMSVFALWILWNRRNAQDMKPFSSLLPACSAAVAILLGGAFFFLRNVWETGNPLFPADFTILGMAILPGLYDASVFVDHGWSPTALAKMLFWDSETFAMKAQFGTLLWSALITNVVFIWKRGFRASDRLPCLIFVIYPLAAVIAYFSLVPFWAEHRLLFPIYFLLFGGLGWCLIVSGEELGDRRSWVAIGLGVFCCLQTAVFVLLDEVPFMLVCIAGIFGLVLGNFPKWIEQWRETFWMIPASVLLGAAFSAAQWYPVFEQKRREARGEWYPREYSELGRAWNLVDRLTDSKPATIAYSGDALIYPLFGKQLANRLYYIKLHLGDRPQPTQLIADESIYLQLSRQRRKNVDQEYWLEQLRERKVDYLFLRDQASLGGVGPELSIIESSPELFEPIFQQGEVYLFRVVGL